MLLLVVAHALRTTEREDMVEDGERGVGGLRGELTAGRPRALGVSDKDLVSTMYLLCVLSVPIPFRGDYIGLQGNPKLQKLTNGTDGPVLMAETVKKVNRGNGKVKARILNPSLELAPELEGWGFILAFPHTFLFCP